MDLSRQLLSSRLRDVVAMASLGLVFYFTGRWGLEIDRLTNAAALIWPPAGISLAALYLYGSRLWPGIFVGGFLLSWLDGTPWYSAMGVAVAESGEALIACYFMRRAGFLPSMERVRDVIALCLSAGFLGAFFSSSVGVTSLYFAGVVLGAGYWETWGMWWLGDLMSNLVLAPVFFLLSGVTWRIPRTARVLEALALVVTLFSILVVAYYHLALPYGDAVYYLLRPNAVYPILIWACLRFGQGGAVGSILIMLLISTTSVLSGGGPVRAGDHSANLLFSVYFVVMASITASILAAIVTTQKRTRRDLRLAKESADRANLAKSTFLANMSHEIRTPLSVILGFSDLMLVSDPTPAERNESTRTIRRNGELLLRLVDDILDFSKIEAGRLEVEKIPFSLPVLLEDLKAQFRLKAQEKKIELRFDLSGLKESQLVSDPTRLKQVLMNVIGNAIKFTETGYVEVVVRNLPGRRVELLVQDTGIGIDAEHVRRLFQPFMQGDGSTTRRFGGAGLGLALSRTLSRLLGGDLVLLQSEKGKGSRFRVTIDSGLPEQVAVAPEGARKGFNWKGSLENTKVLLVEDAADNRLLARRLLEFAGATVEIADDGLQGLEKALARVYDVVLMDLQMPGLDGFEATATLRARNYQGPIVALTANVMPECQKRCRETGFTAHLTKPINPTALFQTIARCRRAAICDSLSQ